MRAWLDDLIEVVVSPALAGELSRVLRRPKFAHAIDNRRVTELMERLQRHATVVDDPTSAPAVTRDQDDDYLVALARAVDADFLVSGDRDLLALDIADIRIVSPRDLADRLDEAS